jgi:heterodisulfide reductase subunit A-like polyferredoxin
MAERIGFYICHCGINIASKVRCTEVAEFIGTLDDVVISRDYLFMCSDPGQELIEKDIAEYGLTRVVVSSCSPRMHERTFRAACQRGGLNPFRSFHHVCVREHVSWVHKNEDEATQKAKELSLAGILRVARQEELHPQTFPVNTNTLVVGGGIAGMQASLDIAKAGYKAYLVEKTATVGGHMLQYDKTFPTLDCAACIGTPKMVSVGQDPNIELLTLSTVEEVSGFIGNFKVKIKKKARYVDTVKCTGCGTCAAVNIDDDLAIKEHEGLTWIDRLRIDESKCIHCGECVVACNEENPGCSAMTNIVKQRLDAVSSGVEILAPTILQQVLTLPIDEREAFWQSQFRKCIKCYGCIDMCPVHVKDENGLDLGKWVAKGQIPPSYPVFHLIRAYQVWDTCVLCGECENTCPAHIPLKTVQDIIRLFPPEKVFELIPGLEPEAQKEITDFVKSKDGETRRAKYAL